MEIFFEGIYKLMDIILPFEWVKYAYMKRALLGILLISPMCAAMGVPTINFRMVFFTSAISHSVFAGVALGLITGIDPLVAMIVFGVIVGIGITNVRRRSELSNDTVIGVFFSFTVALGIVIISAKRAITRNLNAIVYGDILTISELEIIVFFVLFIITFIFLAYSYNPLLLKGINSPLAKTRGVNTGFYDYAFAFLLALVVTTSVRAVGLLLITAMLVVPAGAGRNLAKSARQQFWYSIIIGLVSGVAGVVVTYYWGTATGATIIIFAAAIFMGTQYLPRIVRLFKT